MAVKKRQYNGSYTGEYLNHIAFPLGGMGAGMVCMEGTGAFSHLSLRGQPEIFNEPEMFSALCVKGEANLAKLLEGPVPQWKFFGPPGTGNGGRGKTYGLPRCTEAIFEARFPFAIVKLAHPDLPLQVELTGWSPFTPGDADRSSLPVAALEYRFVNPTDRLVEAVYSFHARNFMATGSGGDAVGSTRGGFVLWQPGSDEKPWDQGGFSAVVDDPEVRVNCAWFRGGWFDSLTMVWNTIAAGAAPQQDPLTQGDPSPGGSLYLPFQLQAGEEKTICVRLAWHVPETDIRIGQEAEAVASCCDDSCCGDKEREDLPRHRPWYARAFADIEAVTGYWNRHYAELRESSATFSDCFYDTTLPPEVIEAVAANLTILKSPTVLRQTDGRLWCWEGCTDDSGCCAGSCTHVWNYAQALPHLFPDMERSLRQTEFNENQDERGHQNFRANLPIRFNTHDFHAAADGQLGGIIKVFREWRVSGDRAWMKNLWPKVRKSLEYCIETWDPDHEGVLKEPHHNTYDIEFWGPDGMCTSFYLGALKAAILMGREVGDDIALFEALLEKGRAFMQSELWNGEYFIQKIQWRNLRAADPSQEQSGRMNYSPEARELLQQEGPKYQYGTGCLSDGVLGAWLAHLCGVGAVLEPAKETGHLQAVYKYNFRTTLSDHANPQRPTYALGNEGGLLLCSWPKGGKLSLPFVYSDEVWTGIEYQVASHLMLMGCVEAGLEIVRTCRDRYDGRIRNPFNEYECGHWYARAMSSYGLLQGMTGVGYDAVEKILYIKPRQPGDFRVFLSTATGYGTVGVRNGEPFVEVRQGTIPYATIAYEPA